MMICFLYAEYKKFPRKLNIAKRLTGEYYFFSRLVHIVKHFDHAIAVRYVSIHANVPDINASMNATMDISGTAHFDA